MSLNYPVLQEYIHALPFSVQLAQSVPDLAGACAVRADYHARLGYSAEAVERLRKVDLLDSQARVLVAKDYASGEVLGTVTVFCSLDGQPPVPGNFPLHEVGQDTFLYLSRFGVAPGEHAVAVTAALGKAVLKLTIKDQVDWILTASHPEQEQLLSGVGLRLLGTDAYFKQPGGPAETSRGFGERVIALIKFAHRMESPLKDFVLVKHKDIKV